MDTRQPLATLAGRLIKVSIIGLIATLAGTPAVRAQEQPLPRPAGLSPLEIRVPLEDGTPLPDKAWLIQQVRERLKPDSELLRQYTYRERRQKIKVSRLGKVSLGERREFEVYPSAVSGETYKRLIAVDGEPLDAETLARNDRIHRENQRKRQQEIAEETPEERAERLAELAEAEQEEQAIIDDGFEVFEIQLLGREMVDGRPMIVAEITPRPDAKPKTREGKTMKHMRGRAWVDEQDYELAQAEIEIVKDVTLGWGLLGRLHSGSELSFKRTNVNDEIWLPAMMRAKMSGRTLLLRTFGLETTTEYWDYQKFNVDTSVAGATPKRSGDEKKILEPQDHR